jgi:hypothetical protein
MKHTLLLCTVPALNVFVVTFGQSKNKMQCLIWCWASEQMVSASNPTGVSTFLPYAVVNMSPADYYYYYYYYYGAAVAQAVQCLTTGWTIGWSRFDPRQRQRIFLLAPASRPALGPTQAPTQWVSGVLSPGVKRGRGVTLTTHPHLVAEVKYE